MVEKSELPLPAAFLERMSRLLGDEFPSFLQSYAQPPAIGLRVNTLKISPEAYQHLSPFALSPIPWCPSGFLVSGEAQPGKHPHHAAGLYYIQEPSAMAAAEALAPMPGERVLDLAAAPGGKSTHLAALMNDEGLLIANEIHPKRVWELVSNLERWGVQNAIVLQETPERLAEHFGAGFDRVMLDAPCSGEGMFRRSETARREWTPALPKSCAIRQERLLESAARLLRPGGSLVYATCTFAPEENEAVLDRFLASHQELELVSLEWKPGFAAGRADWAAAVTGYPLRAELARCVRLWPHLSCGEGHFVALLRKKDGETQIGHSKLPRQAIPDEVRKQLRDFYAQNLHSAPPEGRLLLIGSDLYQLPQATPDLRGLRLIRLGLQLGTVKKNRFEPAHALALAMRTTDALRSLNLLPNSPELYHYLRGEQLPSHFREQGWVLVSVQGFALGWGKSSQGILKNLYPRGLRWLAPSK